LHNLKNYTLFLLIIGVFFTSCSKEKFEATIPSYISINQITVAANYLTEGSSSQKIKDAWVYINDNLVGIYELPAKIPILKEGSYTLKIYAGIKENGLTDARVQYLFYAPYEEQVTLIKNKVLSINPELKYSSLAKFGWMEDFDKASLSFSYTTGSDTIINKTTTGVFEGVSSGKVLLTSSMGFFEIQSPEILTIPKNGTPVFLEVNFKTNEPVLVGVYADNDQFGVVYLNRSTEWNKIYINLTGVINEKQYASKFKVFFGLSNSSTPFSVANPEFYLDNIKLIHF